MSSQSATQETGNEIYSPPMNASPPGQQSSIQSNDGGSQVSSSPYGKSKREAKSEWAALSLSSSSSYACGIVFGDSSGKPTKRGWMKIRGVMKQWTIRLFDLRPPYLIYFKDEDDEIRDVAVGIIDLKGCKVSERESKKDGFCFKISSLSSSTIYTSRGLKNEILATKLAPMNTSIAILRVVTREEGLEWISAINSAIEYANSLETTLSPSTLGQEQQQKQQETVTPPPELALQPASSSTPLPNTEKRKEKSKTNKQSGEQQKVAPPKTPTKSQRKGEGKKKGTPPPPSQPTEGAIIPLEKLISFQGLKALDPEPTNYAVEIPKEEMKIDAFEQGKNIILQLLKQVKPGMDLTKITLPTHILEPRSFLEKMTDYFAHIELISEAIHNPDPVMRLLKLTKWYISGFYIMPKTPKKPYNPIIGETFRCKWEHPASSHGPASNSFLICEQVSHHPPVSAIYAGNRADGWVVNGSILFKSKFWGTSAGCLLEGYATMYVPEFNEEYKIGFPSAIAKGFIVGPLTMEMFGEVTIESKTSGLISTIDFKTKPTFRGEFNCVGGSLRRAGTNEVLYEYSGRYDREVFCKDVKTGATESMWKVTPGLEKTRLTRYTIPFDEQDEFASERLWDKVTKALIAGDQTAATEDKTRIENLQRKIHKDLEAKGEKWKTKLFDYDENAKEWVYKWMNKARFDPEREAGEYDADGRIITLLKDDVLKAFEAAPPREAVAGAGGARRRRRRRANGDDVDDDVMDDDYDVMDEDDDDEEEEEEDEEEEEEGMVDAEKSEAEVRRNKERIGKLKKAVATNNGKIRALNKRIVEQEKAIEELKKSLRGMNEKGGQSGSDQKMSSLFTYVLGLVLVLMIIILFRK